MLSAHFNYAISGLAVKSDIELPSAIPTGLCAAPDVIIQQTDLPPAAADQHGASSDAEGFRFWLRITSSGRFLIEDGKRILYQPLPNVDPGELVLQLIGTCFSVLLQQRGQLVLHASAVSVRNKAVLFCGDSGAGKSTLAAMLGEQGYPLLNDDVCNLSMDEGGSFSVCPDGRMLKLWSASLEHLRQPKRGAQIQGRADKFYATPAATDSAQRQVAAIYFLRVLESGEAPTITPLGRARGVAALHDNAYRLELVHAMGQEQTYFQSAARLCSAVPMLQLSRAKDWTESAAVVRLLQASWLEDL